MSVSAGGILLDLAIIILGAKLAGEAAERIRQPAVLGELLVGVLLSASLLGGWIGLPDLSFTDEGHDVSEGGDTGLAGVFFLDHGGEWSAATVLSLLGALGAILLLFQVGLESKVSELRKVGASSLLVALIGIVVSFAVGFAASQLLASLWPAWQAADAALPPYLLHVFIGATMTATSVGITARVLSDMDRLATREARVILGAAVLDDIGGLIVLAVVGALVTAAQGGADVDALALARIGVTAVGFLLVAVVLGLRVVPRAFDWMVDRFRIAGFPVALALGWALLMSYLASLAGLADIVGAFAGGIVLAETRHAHRIREDLGPLAAIFVGFFFVTLGMRVDVTAFAGNGIAVVAVGFALALVAVLAKLSCAFGVLKGQADRLVVGVGMVPRGEVGLIFASLGLAAGLLTEWQYGLLLLVVLLTTVVTPVWLGRLRGRFQPADGAPPGHGMATVMEA